MVKIVSNILCVRILFLLYVFYVFATTKPVSPFFSAAWKQRNTYPLLMCFAQGIVAGYHKDKGTLKSAGKHIWLAICC